MVVEIICVHCCRNHHTHPIGAENPWYAMFGNFIVSIEKCEIVASCLMVFHRICMLCTLHTAHGTRHHRLGNALCLVLNWYLAFIFFLLLYSYVRACGFQWSDCIFQSRKSGWKLVYYSRLYDSCHSSQRCNLTNVQSYVNYYTNFAHSNDKTVRSISKFKLHTVHN